MGLFALLARFVPRWVRREERPHFAAAPMAPRRLERRRVFDAAAAGVMLEAIPDMQPFVQTGENLTATTQTATTQNIEQDQQVAALNGFPQVTIRLRDAELFEDQSTLVVISISDSSPMTHQVTIDWGDGSPLQVINAGAQQREVLAVHKYLDDNPTATSSDKYTVSVTVMNSLGESATTSAEILVKNVAPTIGSLSINSPINENDTATLTGTYSDPGTLDTHQLDIDWDGNGSFDQTVTVSGGNFSVSRQILDDNPTGTSSDTFNVNVRLRDDDGGQATRSAQLTVRNVAPVLSNVTITSPIVENATATLTGNYTDAGTQDTHQLEIDWDGNGTYDQTVTVNGGSFSVSRQFVDDNPTGTTSDTFNVNVRLRDDDGGQATATTSLTIQNSNPVVVLNSLATIDENGIATLTGTYTDVGSQDTHELDIDWDGDGVFDQTVVVTGGAFTVTRQFLDDNPTGTSSDTFNVNVRLRDDDGGTATASQTLTVRNVAPVITRLTIETPIDENGSTTLTGEFTDVGTQDTHELDIDWDGDGTYDETATVTGGNFSVTRQFLDDNPTGTASDTFNVNVRLRDDDGGEATRAVPLAVRNVAPVLSNVTITSPIVENGTATLTGTYSDVGTQDTQLLDIDWDGNGSYDQTVTVTGGSFSVSRQFLDDNPTGTPSDTFNVNVRLRDDDGGQATATTLLTVQNANPIVALNPLATINENGTATLTGTYTDIGSEDTHQLDIDWDGDGTFDQTVAVVGGAFTVTRQFLDDNPTGTASDTFNVNVRLRDDDGGSDIEATPLTVRNVNPVVTLVPPANINENEFATLQGMISDVGTLDTFTLEINWGDSGSPTNTQSFDLGTTVLTEAVDGINWDPTTRTFSLTHQYLDDNPSGTAFDTYTIRATATDDDLGRDVKETTVRVNNVALTLDLQKPATINENEFAVLTGSISDVGSLDTFELEINWGDPGSPNNVESFVLGTTALTQAVDGINWDPTTRTFSLTHQYLDDNPSGTAFDIYMIRATVTDDDNGFDRAQTSITVRNLDLTLQLAAEQTIDEGSELDLTGGLLGSFKDIGTQDTHTATVDWGDGSGVQAVVVTEANGSGTLSADHIYADNGVYMVRVTVIDDDGGSVTGTIQVTVLNVDPTLTGVGAPKVVNEGAEITLSELGVGLEDPGFDNPNNPGGATQEILTAVSVDWGDGSALTPLSIDLLTPGGENVTTKATFAHAAHAYADDGTYTVSIVVRDDDGEFVIRTFTIVVENVDPTLTLTKRVLEINEGDTLDLFDLGTFEDPGFNNLANPNGSSIESFHYSIDWGDGTLTENNLAPATVVNGQQGTLTTGTLADSHLYADNDDDNFFTITVTLFDDDGGSHSQQIQVFVRNVAPDLDPLIATDVTARGIATVTVTFFDPGADDFTVHIDWGDNEPDAVPFTNITTPFTYTFTHEYGGPPNPQNPAADITITVVVRDDDFGIAGVVDIGESQTRTIDISNPGIGGIPFRIDTTPQVPQLTFPVRAEAILVASNSGSNVVVQQNVQVGGTSGEAAASADRYIELRVIDAEGKEGPGFRLRPEVLQDLPGLFRSLPDNHYVIYVVNMETDSRRLVIEVYVRNGKLIDPGDDSEGTRDRPPTDEQTTQPQTAQPVDGSPAEQTPSTNELGPNQPAAALPQQGDLPAEPSDVVPSAVTHRRISRWSALALGLAASSSSQSWAHRVDQAVAQATAQQWRKLQGHNPPKPKKQ